MLFISDPEDFWRSRKVISPHVCPGVCHPAGVKCPVVRFPKVSRFYPPPPPSTAVKVSQECWDTCPKESDMCPLNPWLQTLAIPSALNMALALCKPMLWINIVLKVWHSALHSSTINLPVSFGFVGAVPFKSIFDTFIIYFCQIPLLQTLSISMFEQKRVWCNQLKKWQWHCSNYCLMKKNGSLFQNVIKLPKLKTNQLAKI